MAIASVVLQIDRGHHLNHMNLRQTLVQLSSIWVDIDHSHAKNTGKLSDAKNIGDHGLDMEN